AILWIAPSGREARGSGRVADRARRERRVGPLDANLAADGVARIARIRRADDGPAAIVPGRRKYRRAARGKRRNADDARADVQHRFLRSARAPNSPGAAFGTRGACRPVYLHPDCTVGRERNRPRLSARDLRNGASPGPDVLAERA